MIAHGSSNKIVPSDRSPTNWGLATDQWKLLFELVGDRSVTVPKPFSNQLLQLQEESPWGNRQVADRLQEKKEEIWLSPMTKAPTPTEMSKGQSDNTNNATKKLKPNENSSANSYAFLSLRARRVVCDWGFNELLTPFHSVQCRAMNTALVFYYLFGQDFANLYAFQYHAHEKMSPVLISTRELTFHHTGVWRSYVIRSFTFCKRLYLHLAVTRASTGSCNWVSTIYLLTGHIHVGISMSHTLQSIFYRDIYLTLYMT